MIPISIENARAVASAFRSGADGMTVAKQDRLKLTLVAHTVRGMRSCDLTVEYIEERRKRTIEIHDPVNIVVTHEGLLVQSPFMDLVMMGENPGGMQTAQTTPMRPIGPGPARRGLIGPKPIEPPRQRPGPRPDPHGLDHDLNTEPMHGRRPEPGPEPGPEERRMRPCGQGGPEPPDAPRRGPSDGHPPYKHTRYKRCWFRWLRRSGSR